MRDERFETLQYLRDFTLQLSEDIGLRSQGEHGRLILPDARSYGEYTKLLARCHVELGQWQAALRETSFEVSVLIVLLVRSSLRNRLIPHRF